MEEPESKWSAEQNTYRVVSNQNSMGTLFAKLAIVLVDGSGK